MLKPHWRLWVAILTGWTLVGLTFTLNYYLFSDHYVAIFRQPPGRPRRAPAHSATTSRRDESRGEAREMR